MTTSVYTPETLAERWGCSARAIRNMLRERRLHGFRLGGKLWRISAAEVEAIEGQWKTDQNGASGASEDNLPPFDGSPDVESVISLARIEARQSARSRG